MRVCELSGKRTISGNNVSHSNRKTKRIFKPNLQVATIIIDGQKLRIKACPRYIKKLKRSIG